MRSEINKNTSEINNEVFKIFILQWPPTTLFRFKNGDHTRSYTTTMIPIMVGKGPQDNLVASSKSSQNLICRLAILSQTKGSH